MNIFPVKNFLSTDTGAPSWNGTIGSTISVLDALLIDGFNLKSLVSLTQTGGVATATCATAHGYRPFQVIETGGANESGWNLQAMITATTTTTFTFAVDAGLAASATGTLTAKVAACGWVKEFSGTNKAVYKSTDIDATGGRLRVDDTNALYTLVRAYETMSDVDTGVGMTPTLLQETNYAWKKSSTSDSIARKYAFFGTGKTCVFANAWNTASGSVQLSAGVAAGFMFGDFISFKPGDAYNFLIYAHRSVSPSYPSSDGGIGNGTGAIPYCLRAYGQSGSSIRLTKQALAPNVNSGYSTGTTSYPNLEDSSLLIFGRHFLQDNLNIDWRGIQPGAYHLPQLTPLADYDVVQNVSNYPNKIFMMLSCCSASSDGRMAIDITGPWT
ncbi:MAG: hypothetical protein PHR16_14090 [Methylovulum sp.]|nr:hypothetical protein [Methylovulum sp.]